jgi:flap endonuclease-1
MDVPYAQAESEGETTCSHLCVLGKVDAVISEDNDVLAYGAPFLLTKINTDTETVMEISLERVLEDLEISKETFTDLCIMCGVDYNTNIPNYGPAKSYKMLKILGSIDKITDIDVSILKHERCRELFSVPKTIDYDIKYCGEPNYGELEKFISKNGINGDRRGLFKIDMNNIRKVNKCEIVFTE